MTFKNPQMLCLLVVGAFLLFGSFDVLAQPQGQSLGDIAQRGASQGNQLVNFGRVVAIVIGVFLIIGGILALVKDAKSQGNGPVSKGAAATMIVAGGALTFVTLLIESTGQTVWGNTSGGRDKIEIQQ